MATIPLGSSATAAVRRTSRGRLFRKYLLLIMSLVTIALLASGGISLYFTYQETKASLASLQHEKALAAASRIEQYIERIQQQLSYAALPQLDASDVELRRIEFLKLLRQAPEVTDISQLDANGREQIAVSRLGMDNVPPPGQGRDRSQEPAFRNVKRGQPWFGEVYFRKETEPYMTIALRSGGESGPVIVAEVNLKFIWDVVSRIKIGDKGKAYVVDASGFLVADPDIGQVLRKTNLSELPHVKTALGGGAASNPTLVSKDLSGTEVLTSVAPIESLHWYVFVEQPVSEVYANLYASIVRTGLLLLAGLVLSAFGALALARGMVRPIRTLEEGAERIGSGDLDQKIEVHTGDELEALANRFNRMTTQLKESYSGLERKVDERTVELTQSLEQQTAISDILQVISSSPTDVRPMLNAVAERALKLCDAAQSTIVLVEGNVLRCAASYGSTGHMKEGEEIPLTRGSVAGRAVVDGRAVQVEDLAAAPEDEFPVGRELQRRIGHHTAMAVPLMRENQAIGSIQLWRMEKRAFTDKQIALVKTFADQAAIAIENVRLFNETKEALEQQTATSGVLRSISRTTFELDPVLNTLVENATRLCKADKGFLFVRDGEEYRVTANYGAPSEQLEFMRSHPVRAGMGTLVARTVLKRQTIHIEDAKTDPEYTWGEAREKLGFRTMLGVPMLREGEPIGVVGMWRDHVQPFTAREIQLVTTFADQAVIAIENVRLFNETKEALDQQRASGEVLTAISSSIADTKPVFDKILESCKRLFAGKQVGINLVDDDGNIHIAAYYGPGLAELESLPVKANEETATGRCIAARQVLHFPDVENGTDVPPGTRRAAAIGGNRAAIFAPMIWEGRGIGAIFACRVTPGPFSDKEIALLKTFADQAVIAIQNVRLFNETKEALDQQRASGEVLSAISNSIADTTPVFDKILESCERLFAGTVIGVNVIGEDGLLRTVAHHGPGKEELLGTPVALDRRTATGVCISERRVLHFPDAQNDDTVPPVTRAGLRITGEKAVLFAPMLWEGRGIGSIAVGRDRVGPFSDKEIALLKTFADQAVIAIQNASLLREIQDKSAQLEVANKHKSEFLANMSHELRTPLNAIIGFSEVLSERLFGDINPKQEDYLKDIHSSGKHLLTLINDILDLSKIEAGRMELDVSTFELPAAVANAMTLIRERAQRHNIGLEQRVDEGLGEITADERKFKQILLNLLSNAVKFTPDGGKIEVSACVEGDNVQVAVHDTGIGIAKDDQAAVFEEFRQVGRDYTNKQEGTGLGLALTRKFVELHGGRIWLESEPGKGSTFTFTIPRAR
jgi:signal transduction histidine kinase/HAMP domain-containing protein